jgi:hypothetical protein
MDMVEGGKRKREWTRKRVYGGKGKRVTVPEEGTAGRTEPD